MAPAASNGQRHLSPPKSGMWWMASAVVPTSVFDRQHHQRLDIAAGKEASTVRPRLAALRQFARWLVSEGELPEDQLLGVKPPKIPTKPVNGLSDEQLRAVLKACKGSSFRDKRDEAVVRLMAETVLRASETVSLSVADLQPLKNGVVAVRRRKGMKGPVARLSLTFVFCEDFHIFHSCRVKLDGRRLM
jgi:site-specific recombinase XerC